MYVIRLSMFKNCEEPGWSKYSRKGLMFGQGHFESRGWGVFMRRGGGGSRRGVIGCYFCGEGYKRNKGCSGTLGWLIARGGGGGAFSRVYDVV